MASVDHEKVVDFARHQLEAGAKETQDKAGGPENASVISAQIVVPADTHKAEEVSILVNLDDWIIS